MSRSKIVGAMLKTAKDLRLSSITLREIETLNLEEAKLLKAKEIKKMRAKEKLSQAVMAKALNVNLSTYQKWEKGEIIPKGANLKLLRLAYAHGIEYIL